MKTIAFNGQGRQSGMFRTLFVVAALGGLYYFRRQGGSVADLLAKGTKGLSSARKWVGSSTTVLNPRSNMHSGISSSATI